MTIGIVAQKTFFGHPRGLAYLSFTEAWERFSFYGMQSLLVIYMVQELLLTGHIENVAGMAGYRNAVESILGPLSTQALASQTFGIYAGMVYFTPMIGGWIADRWLGAKKTVMIGVVLMTLGHGAMVFEQSFLLALVLLVLGSGCLKGNIAAQVGQLYPQGDQSASTRGYAIFSTGINIGAVFGPLVCGLLAQIYGWHYGFGTAGIFMVIACGVYWSGRDHLPEETLHKQSNSEVAKLTSEEWRKVLLIFLVLSISVFQSIGYDQTYNVGLVFISEYVDLTTPLGTMPVGWFISINSLATVLAAPLLILLWRKQAARGKEPIEFSKIAIGAFFMSAGSGLFALSAMQAQSGSAGITFPVLANILTGVGFMYYWPTVLAVVARYAPITVKSRMMAMAYLTAFVSGISSGYIGTFYQPLGPLWFWILSLSIPLIGGFIFMLFGNKLKVALGSTAS